MKRSLPCSLRVRLLPLLLFLLPAGVAWGQRDGERTAPNGIITPRRGPFAGKPCHYGDGSGKYTRMAGFRLADLEAAVSGKKKLPGFTHLPDFIWAMENHETIYGSQFAKEGYDRYGELVRACLEDGKISASQKGCRHRASEPIGIHIQTGKPTAEYMMDFIRGYWIIEPGWLQ